MFFKMQNEELRFGGKYSIKVILDRLNNIKIYYTVAFLMW